MSQLNTKQFLRELTENGLLSEADVRAFLEGLPPEKRDAGPQALAREMVRRRMLTSYQAARVCQGRARGLVLGNYVLLDQIGQGGMGEVFKAEHRRMKRLVALKILPQSAMQSDRSIRRFQREVQAAAKLVHPNIVTAYDADEADGTCFLVMEYVDGKDLASVVASEGPFSLDRTLRCVIQAARGLDFAHSKGIIHRDVKPHNLLLDNSGTIKILDMGLVRIEGLDRDNVDGGESLTRENQIVGTVDYMSPEQAEDTRNVDHRSDIYSLGCTVFRLLTGKPPYGGDSTIQKLFAHRVHPVPSLRDHRSDVPEDVDRIFKRMVAKRREDRYQSMSEVIQDVESCLGEASQGETLVAGMSGSTEDSALLRFVTTVRSEGPTAILAPIASPTEATVDLQSQQDTRPEVKSASDVMRRRVRRRRNFVPFAVAGGSVVSLLSIVAMFFYLQQPATLAIRWSAQEPPDQLLVDKKERKIPEGGETKIRLDPGSHQIVANRRGFLPNSFDIDLKRGANTPVRLNWKQHEGFSHPPEGSSTFDPNNQLDERKLAREWIELRTVRRGQIDQGRAERQRALEALQQEVNEGLAMADADPQQVAALWDKVEQYRRNHAGTPEAAQSASLLALFPVAADQLDAQAMPPRERKVAGGGDPEAVPSEVIAVLGDSRLRHYADVFSVAFDPKSNTLAAASRDGTVKLWDAQTGELVGVLYGHVANVQSVAFHPQGTTIASGGGKSDLTLRLWNPATLSERRTLRATDVMEVYTLAFSPDGRTLAAGTIDGLVRLWNVTTGQPRELKGHAAGVESLTFSPDGRSLVSTDLDGNVKYWDVEKGEERFAVVGHQGAAHGAAFLANGDLFLTCGDDGAIIFWDAGTGEERWRIAWEGQRLRSLAVTPDGALVAAAGNDSVRVWSVATATVRQQWEAIVHSLAFNSDGSLLAAGGLPPDPLHVWNVASGQEVVQRKGHTGDITGVVVSPDGTTVVSSSSDRSLNVWGAEQGKWIRALTEHNHNVFGVALLPDGYRAVSCSQDKTLMVWNLTTGTRLQLIDAGDQAAGSFPTCVDVRPDGKVVVAGFASGVVRMWNLDTGQTIGKAGYGHTKIVYSVAFSPDGKYFASTGFDGSVRIWDGDTCDPALIHSGNVSPVRCAAFSPDGTTLAFAGDDRIVRLWDLDSDQQKAELVGHGNGVLAMAFSPDGKTLVTTAIHDAAHPGEIMVWDVASRKATRRLLGPLGSVSAVSFGPEGRYFYTGHEGGAILVWRLESRPKPTSSDGAGR